MPGLNASEIAERVERLVRDVVAPHERDVRCAAHGPSEELDGKLRAKAMLAVSEALVRVADRCVQTIGRTGLTGDTIVGQVFRAVRAARSNDGPTAAHKWSPAKTIKRDWTDAR